MKYSTPILASLATVGMANTATLISKDEYGNVLTSDTVTFDVGQSFSAGVDLSVDHWGPHSIELSSDTYGVKHCDLYMERNHVDMWEHMFGIRNYPEWIG
jgi:hypothetical protein